MIKCLLWCQSKFGWSGLRWTRLQWKNKEKLFAMTTLIWYMHIEYILNTKALLELWLQLQKVQSRTLKITTLWDKVAWGKPLMKTNFPLYVGQVRLVSGLVNYPFCSEICICSSLAVNIKEFSLISFTDLPAVQETPVDVSVPLWFLQPRSFPTNKLSIINKYGEL